MRRTAALATALVSVLLVAGSFASADAATSDVEEIIVDGNPVETVVTGVPKVGSGPAVRRYHDSGRFDADRAAVASAARVRLAEVAISTCPAGTEECIGTRAAIVVDVDDTLLDWYPSYARAGFHLSGKARQADVQACATPAIRPVRALVNDAQRLGIAVLIVSGRREPARAATASCLKRRGVSGWNALVLRSPAEDKLTSGEYKRQAVERLHAGGWDVVLTIGDQQGDLSGDPTTSRFLLPNPLYLSR